MPAEAGKGGPRLRASLQCRHPVKLGWGPSGSEQPGTVLPRLPVKHALGLDAAFVPWVETLACCPASPGRQAAFSQVTESSSPELCSQCCPCASRLPGTCAVLGSEALGFDFALVCSEYVLIVLASETMTGQ